MVYNMCISNYTLNKTLIGLWKIKPTYEEVKNDVSTIFQVSND